MPIQIYPVAGTPQHQHAVPVHYHQDTLVVTGMEFAKLIQVMVIEKNQNRNRRVQMANNEQLVLSHAIIQEVSDSQDNQYKPD